MPYYRDLDGWSETDDDEVEDESEAETDVVTEDWTGDQGHGGLRAESEQEVAETPQLQTQDNSVERPGSESSSDPVQTSHTEKASSRIAEEPAVSDTSETDSEPKMEEEERNQREVLENPMERIQVDSVPENAKPSRHDDGNFTSTVAETPSSERLETERKLGDESEERAQQKILAKFTQPFRTMNDQAPPQTHHSQSTSHSATVEQPSLSRQYPVDMRVSDDAWLSSSESDDDEDARHDMADRQQSTPILLSSDSEETESSSNRKRKRTTPIPTHDTSSQNSKRPRTSLRRSSSPRPRANVVSDLGPLEQARHSRPTPIVKMPSDRGSHLQHHLPPSLPPIHVGPDQDPLLQSHLIHLLPPNILSVGSIRFADSSSKTAESHASNATSDEDELSLPASQTNSPPASTNSSRWPKSLLSSAPKHVRARAARMRRDPLVKLLNRRYLADRSSTLLMVGNLSKDPVWAQLTADQREAVKARRTLELMERRFRDGKSQSAALARLLALVAQRGYSEGILLRLLLQRDSCQKVLGEILRDVVDVDANGEMVLKGDAAALGSGRQGTVA